MKINSYIFTGEQQRERQELSSSSSNTPVSDITVTDISRSTDELPTQPKLASYRLNKDKRCFRSQWFSQFSWLEYSE
jgi:hypothetical protein